MPKPGIALLICPGDLHDVLRVLRAGLDAEEVSEVLREGLNIWCDEMDAFGADPEETQETVVPFKLGVDVGGVLSKYPDKLVPLLRSLGRGGFVEVHILTDMDRVKVLDMLEVNDVDVPPERVHACDHEGHGEACKAVKAAELGLDMLWDDYLGYLAAPGAPPLRMLVMPDPTRDYYHPTWITDGSEGTWGRRLQQRKDTA
jgi:hypothetical protein